MKEINVGILGFGTVGAGVAKILIEKKGLIQSRMGASLILKRVADIDLTTDRGVKLDKDVLTDDGVGVVDDPEIDIIVELIGGQGIAKDLTLRAIKNGKQVVSANKALLAEQGKEIFAAASEKGADLAYEAAVGGCMPIIKAIRESFVGNRITAMTGILNGTCNYILTRCSDEKISFEEALQKAQADGIAEADPTLDVEGFDASHKLAILSSIAYGAEIELEDIYREGISKITPMDMEYAEQFGYRIKLLAISKYHDDRIEARVHPTMIPFEKLLSNVKGSVNAISVFGDAIDEVLLKGFGAGMMPTASAVVGDIVDLARNIMTNVVGRIPVLSFQQENIRKRPIIPIEELYTHYYIRFSALDRPGVLSRISGILGENEISIETVHQKGRKTKGSVPIVMLTHKAREVNIKKALNEISNLDIVENTPALIRIEDERDDK